MHENSQLHYFMINFIVAFSLNYDQDITVEVSPLSLCAIWYIHCCDKSLFGHMTVITIMHVISIHVLPICLTGQARHL